MERMLMEILSGKFLISALFVLFFYQIINKLKAKTVKCGKYIHLNQFSGVASVLSLLLSIRVILSIGFN